MQHQVVWTILRASPSPAVIEPSFNWFILSSRKTGIVARHAYSVMDIQEVEGYRLLFVRNPWACVRWKGSFSPGDAAWTTSIESACNYSSAEAARCDNGSFWIEWNDVIKWFSHLYLCWNTFKLPVEKTIHSRWGLSPHLHSSILIDDSHCAPYNPQVRIDLFKNLSDNSSL